MVVGSGGGEWWWVVSGGGVWRRRGRRWKTARRRRNRWLRVHKWRTFAALSRIISMMGFSAPVCLKKARCCFSTIRTGLMNGAERIDAHVAAAKPGLPLVSPVTTP